MPLIALWSENNQITSKNCTNWSEHLLLYGLKMIRSQVKSDTLIVTLAAFPLKRIQKQAMEWTKTLAKLYNILTNSRLKGGNRRQLWILNRADHACTYRTLSQAGRRPEWSRAEGEKERGRRTDRQRSTGDRQTDRRVHWEGELRLSLQSQMKRSHNSTATESHWYQTAVTEPLLTESTVRASSTEALNYLPWKDEKEPLSDKCWNCFKGNVSEASVRQGGWHAHMGFCEQADTTLNWTIAAKVSGRETAQEERTPCKRRTHFAAMHTALMFSVTAS